jgi:hypothetical protein
MYLVRFRVTYRNATSSSTGYTTKNQTSASPRLNRFDGHLTLKAAVAYGIPLQNTFMLAQHAITIPYIPTLDTTDRL